MSPSQPIPTTPTPPGVVTSPGDRAGGAVSLHRPARSLPPAPPVDPVVVLAPPVRPERQAGGLAALLGALAGGMGTVLFALLDGGTRFLVIALSLAALAIAVTGGAQLSRRRAERRSAARVAGRYRAYLEHTERHLIRVATLQRAALTHCHPGPEGLWGIVTTRRRLWERHPEDPDFGEVRVGTGTVPLAAPVRIDLGSDPVADHDPVLREEALALVARHRGLAGAPVTISLAEPGPTALVGEQAATRALAAAIVLELAALHAPQHLRITVTSAETGGAGWEWVGRLPHAGVASFDRPESADPFLSPASLADLLDREEALGAPPGAMGAPAPAPAPGNTTALHVAVVDGYDPDGPGWSGGPLARRLGVDAPAGVALLVLVGDVLQTPPSTRRRIVVRPSGQLDIERCGPGATEHPVVTAGGGVDEAVSSGSGTCAAPAMVGAAAAGTPEPARENDATEHGPVPEPIGAPRGDAAPPELCTALAAALADLPNGTPAPARAPASLLELLDADHRPGPLPRLVAPLGTNGNGAVVALDLREAAEGGLGPHGLVVGATGSGKSELLRTIVTGLVLGEDPESLAVVLVDYKGGAALAGLAELPHVAGVVTNLEAEPGAIRRFGDSLLAELVHRQRVLAGAGALESVRAYQRRRNERQDLELPPLPSLLVLVDEFGELLAAEPDLLDVFVSIGRTGRSLGVHLLLATQRLEEGRLRGLESHLRFRVCLRTFSPGESIATLGSRVAFDLPPAPGAGYLAGDGRLTRFQAVRVGSHPDQLAEVVARRRMELGAGRRARRVWQPPLPEQCSLAALEPPRTGSDPVGAPGDTLRQRSGVAPLDLAQPGGPGWLQAPLGLVDRPRSQAQDAWVLDLGGAGGHLAVVGGPRSGKSTTLASTIVALAGRHSPEDLHVYVVDFGGGTLRALDVLPHVGAVLGPHQREEVLRLFHEVERIREARARELRRLGLAGPAEWHGARRSGRLEDDRYGEVLLAIDNLATLLAAFPELETPLGGLAADGLGYGIHLLCTAPRWADVRPSLRDHLGSRIELHLQNPLDSEIDRGIARQVAPGIPGRGVVPPGELVQIALGRPEELDLAPHESGPGTPRPAGASASVRRGAPRLTILPEELPLDRLRHLAGASETSHTRPQRLLAPLLGVDEAGGGACRLELPRRAPHALVLGEPESGKTNALALLAAGILAEDPGAAIALVDSREHLASTLGAACAALLPGRAGALGEDRSAGQPAPTLGPPPATDVRGVRGNSNDPGGASGTGGNSGSGGAWLPGAIHRASEPGAVAALVRALATELSNRNGELSNRNDASARPGLDARGTAPPARIVLVVDDYELLGANGASLLGPLVEFFATANSVGFHLVLGRALAGWARAAYDPVLQRLRELEAPVLLLSGAPNEGPVVGDYRAEPLPPGRAMLFERRRRHLVQLGLCPAGGKAGTGDAGQRSGQRV